MVTDAGIAVGGFFATVVVAIIKYARPPKANGNGVFQSKEVCVVVHKETDRRLDEINVKLDTLIMRK
jgi:hypothetical protein